MRRALCVAAVALVACAQNTTVQCPDNLHWTYNSLGQNPCVVGAYLLSACENDPTTVTVSSDVADAYPTYGLSVSPCSCSSVTYSVLSACALCAGADHPVMWSVWTSNCEPDFVSTEELPFPVPTGTLVPIWAFLNVQTRNSFDPASASNAAGVHEPDVPPSTTQDNPSATPAVVSADSPTTSGAATGASPPPVVLTSSSASSGLSSSHSTSGTHSPHPEKTARTTAPPGRKQSAVPVVAGVLGGIAGVAVITSAIAYVVQRRKAKGLCRRHRRSSVYEKYHLHHLQLNPGLSPGKTSNDLS